ncbi:MAG: TRAP transporter large permease subunit, partial [Pseudomonadota bacterium]
GGGGGGGGGGFLLVAGFFLPPVAVILMTAPTLVPIIEAVGFDPIWFAVMLTVNMEIGLITPPVGLNLYVIKSIAPDLRLPTILWRALPFMLCMVVGIVLLCFFPQIALWLPTVMMGAVVVGIEFPRTGFREWQCPFRPIGLNRSRGSLWRQVVRSVG